MWHLAWRNLLREPARLALSAAGVAFSVVLMLSLLGLYNSFERRVERYYQGVGADLWVAQSGTANFFNSPSVLPASARGEVAGIVGVASVRPYLGRIVAFRQGGEEFRTFAVGIAGDERVGGAITVVEGTARPGPGEIVIDRVLAKNTGLSIGDRVRIRDLRLRVAGVSAGGDMVAFQYSFVAMSEARRLQGTVGVVNFLLVELLRGADPTAVARRIEDRLPDAEAWTEGQVIDRNQGVIEDAFLPMVAVLLAIGFVVGTAVIGLTTYSAVLEKRREYGVLKALGATFGAGLRAVLSQSAIAGATGYLLGVAAGLAVGRWVPGAVPQFTIDIDGRHLVGVLALAGAMVLASVFFPLRRIGRIDPAEVFTA
ncbi:MAG: ABC transporter permease [Actinobacteria bacterium]|nr:ABC transporter permease [Actinomycetota bacterium]